MKIERVDPPIPLKGEQGKTPLTPFRGSQPTGGKWVEQPSRRQLPLKGDGGSTLSISTMKRVTLKSISALIMIVFGMVLAFIALFMPPQGEIDESVIYVFAQVLIYAGSVFGFDVFITQRIREIYPKPIAPTKE